ncbi:oxygen-independent coproporphyrinogen-3 oxidase [Alkalithermobacter thermoalcaliphilus JW-YL-7 = DSM 7308]|uniref:Coproporphyrinogen III oxidase n=1 Tax=Alkalithermobacter thermoalcaliphilus JW-YL-7 = DSM 7308 TaxID=1121328 RepID=A0A150FQF7_CLOPD|nr:Coproporphyrinogen III oxidase [[Clostridium] paradoxum JW-YL-7 = DSM 7308]SHK51789.1 oxygen-independent coproporphyrinogen-3 oxidase [[Clostridium] paradoxum JW-YL-7 = DSM 7308]
MLNIFLKGHDYRYEVGELVKIFTSNFRFEDSDRTNVLINEVLTENRYIISKASIYENNILKFYSEEKSEILLSDRENIKELKRLIKKSIFEVLKRKYNTYAPWGILTGVRPTKIVHELIDNDLNENQIKDILIKKYNISESKADLLITVAIAERKFIYPVDGKKISLYISIPFCPTRCLYCSFVSNDLKSSSKYTKDYIDALIKEIKGVSKIIEKSNKKIQTIYMGGGTPTSIDSSQLKIIIDEIYKNFDLSNLEEFTVEAGRPDTIDKQKLKVLKDMDVTRISINPQTMNDKTLREIGRNHTTQDIINAFYMAKDVGFENINMDIILGLPNETIQMVENTLQSILRLSPESLTVHTMAVKRASKLKENIQNYDLSHYNEVVNMIQLSQIYAEKMNLKPYYMYRQKHMVGNLENIGYAKQGFECIYNIQIMEEKQTILALGAGAVSKVVYLDENRIERIPNVKDIQSYILRVDEMIKRKEGEVLKNAYKSS